MCSLLFRNEWQWYYISLEIAETALQGNFFLLIKGIKYIPPQNSTKVFTEQY